MNVFVINTSIKASCEEMAQLDPTRAMKQLLECCQILASAEHLVKGYTTMLKADGTPYGKAHPHHPCTKYAATSSAYNLVTRLVAIYPTST
jgi:hypothetical protein